MKSIAVGIDVSKETLDVFFTWEGKPKSFTLPNQESPIRKLAAQLPQGATINMEATGGYERKLKNILQQTGFDVRVHNPRRVRRMADVQGIGAKIDKLDAKVLAACGQMLKAPARAKTDEQEHLSDTSRIIQSLKDELTGHKKRLGKPGLSKSLIADLKRIISHREAEIKRLEAKYVAQVQQSSRAEMYALLRSVGDVGPCLGRVLSAELPDELSDWNARQLAALAGLAPMDHASGKSTRRSRTSSHGNMRIKAALYMPALCAKRHQPWARDMYARLRAKGKCHRLAMVAIMRKLLLMAVAVVKRGSAWMAEPT